MQKLIKHICIKLTFFLSITWSVNLLSIHQKNIDIEQRQNQSYIGSFIQKLKDDFDAVSPEYRLAFTAIIIGALIKKIHDDYYLKKYLVQNVQYHNHQHGAQKHVYDKR